MLIGCTKFSCGCGRSASTAFNALADTAIGQSPPRFEREKCQRAMRRLVEIFDRCLHSLRHRHCPDAILVREHFEFTRNGRWYWGRIGESEVEGGWGTHDKHSTQKDSQT